MLDIICLVKYVDISEDLIYRVNKGITSVEYDHFMTHAACLLDEDELEDLNEYLVPEKTVLGFLKVPNWAQWLCITNNGSIAVFDKEPTLKDGLWFANGKGLEIIGKVDSYDDWAKSKTKLPASS